MNNTNGMTLGEIAQELRDSKHDALMGTDGTWHWGVNLRQQHVQYLNRYTGQRRSATLDQALSAGAAVTAPQF